MRFSWKAIALAPSVVPLMVGLIFATSPGGSPLFSFALLFGIGCVVSYGVSVGLFLPCVFVLSRFTRLNVWLTGLVGLALGLVVYFPVGWQSYLASGDNSSPPSESFVSYLARNFLEESWPFYVGGLVTALLYWLLSKPQTGSLKK